MEDKSMQYIQDWHKRAKSKQRKYNVIMVGVLLLTFIICIFFVYMLKEQNYNRIIDHNKKYIQDSAIQEANQVEQKIDDTVYLIRKYAQQYAIFEEHIPDTTTEERINILCDRTIFDRLAFITIDGYDTFLEGTADVSDREYFVDALKGNTGYCFVPESRVTGRPSLIFYAPVKVDGEIIGVLGGFFERERLDDLLSYEFLNFSPDTYLLTGEGIVVANSKTDYIVKNMLSELSEKSYIGDVDYSIISEAIEDNQRTSITFMFEKNGKSVIGVIAQFEGGKTSDWMVLSVLPYQVTEDMLNDANNAGKATILSIIASLAIMIIVFLWLLSRRYRSLEKDMSVTAENLRITSSHDQTQSFIISSLGNTYSSIYHVKIDDNSYVRIKEAENSVLCIHSSGNWTENFTNYVENFVDKQYREEMKVFDDVKTFESRLGKNEKFVVEYQRIEKTWRKAIMLPAERDSENRITSVIYAVQRIDEEKERSLYTQLALKEAYEAAQLASVAKTTFLSNMSHDIRTPMNAIVGMTAIAGANIDNKEKVADCLKKINSASKHLLGLINEVLDMSKIESGKVDLGEEEFSLSDIIDELITMNQGLVKEKNHNLSVTIENLTHENVIGDGVRLQQVFTNMLTNAIKYTPSGGNLEIIVREKNTNKSNIGWYEVVFKDNGIGMSEDFVKRIFEPFSRSEDERITSIQGTGLGMAIARNIVRMMNGDIAVKSEINKGSEFTVSFSLKLQTEKIDDYSAFVDLPVLVVDDDITACKSTCLILDSLSMNSEWVTSGKAAVEKVVERHERNDDYHAVIIDWVMPEMDGVKTTRAIREKVGNEIPIIILTAYDWSEIEHEAKEAGVNAFLSKPLFKSKLVHIFHEFNSYEVPKKSDIEKNDFSGKRILLAEDNELNSEIAIELLGMIGLEIEHAENGKICYEMFEKSEPGYYDMVLMDIQMPVMNGYEATRKIRSSEHKCAKTIPIVAMTANAFSTDVRSAFDAGMNGHISKPIDINNVINVLKENLR